MILVIIFFLALAGAFLFYNHKAQYLGGFKIEGNLIENDKFNLTFLAPESWQARNFGEGGIGLFSPEVDADDFANSAREKGACLVGVSISEEKSAADYVRSLIEENRKNKEDGEYQVITLNGKEALKRTLLKDGKVIFAEAQVPIKNLIYHFDTSLIYSDKCIGYFEDVLKTVQIGK